MSQLFKKIGPLMGMMQNSDGDTASINPMDIMSQMMGGMNKKQKKALQMSGMANSFKTNTKPKQAKAKKGSKPSVKGFNS